MDQNVALEMGALLKTPWWMTVLRGVAALLFGIAVLLWPGITIATVLTLFAVFMFVSGIIDIISSIGSMRHNPSWWLTMLLGIVQIIAGVWVAQNITTTLAIAILVIGFVFVIRGILEFIMAFDLKGSARAFFIIIGILTAAAGVFILRNPVSGGLAFAWVLGVYGLIAGPISIALGLQVKELQESHATKK